jgi:hypothetical protein
MGTFPSYVYLVEAEDLGRHDRPGTGRFIWETGYAGADEKTTIEHLIEGQFEHHPIRRILRFEPNAVTIEDATAEIVRLADKRAADTGRDLPANVVALLWTARAPTVDPFHYVVEHVPLSGGA